MRQIAMLLFAMLAAIGFFCSSQNAMAAGHNSQSTLGSQGREIAVVECPAGEVLKGFRGRKGAAIDQIQILCAPMLSDGTYGATHAYRDAYGGFGGGPFPENACNPVSRVAGGHVALTPDNRMVAGISLTCVDRAGNVVGTVSFFGATSAMRGQTFECNDVTLWQRFTNSCQHGATADYTCPDESFIGIRVRYDSVVRGLGFLCDVRNPPARAAAPLPANKPIKATGKPRTPKPAAPTGPPLAARTSISGPWKVTAGDERYNLMLTAAGNGFMPGQGDTLPFAVIGTLAGADGSPDATGNFSANMLANRQVQGGYGLKNGVSGQCLLNYTPDGQSLFGDCSRGKEGLRWTATRGSWPVSEPKRVDRTALHTVEVKLSVDVFANPGGDGDPIAQLRAGTDDVELVQACKDDWCHVRWPGHEGWVYSGEDYNSLGQ